MNKLIEQNVVRASYLGEGQRLYLSLHDFLNFLEKEKNEKLCTKTASLLKKLSEGKGDMNEWIKLVQKIEKSVTLRLNKPMLEWCEKIHKEHKFGNIAQKSK